MTPVLETNFKPVKVSAEVCREACKKISNPEHGTYFQELFRQFSDTFQLDNKQLAIIVDSRQTGDVNFIIESAQVPVEKLPPIAFNPPLGIKLVDQRFEPVNAKMNITFCYHCTQLISRRDRSPRRSSSSSSSRSPPPRRHRSRRPQTPSPPRGWSLFGQ